MAGNKNFGRQLRKLREIKGYSQEQLAELVGLEYQTISRIETGVYFTNFENLGKLAKALDVNIKDLFDFSEENITKDQWIKLINNHIENLDCYDLENIYKLICLYKNKK